MERRDFIQGLLAGSVTVLAAGSAQASPLSRLMESGSVAPLLEPLQVGDHVGLAWSVRELTDVKSGAAVLVLEHQSGRTARVHLCQRRGAPVGVAHSGTLDFMVMNDASGADPTDESLARVLRALAELARRNEAQGAMAPGTLLPHDARLSRYRDSAALS